MLNSHSAVNEQAAGAHGPDGDISDTDWGFPDPACGAEAADPTAGPHCGFGAEPEPESVAPRSAMKVSEFEQRQRTDHSRLDRLYGAGGTDRSVYRAGGADRSVCIQSGRD